MGKSALDRDPTRQVKSNVKSKVVVQ